MWGGDDLVVDTVLAGGWRASDGKTHLFVFNIRDEAGEATVSLRASEYGITGENIPAALADLAPHLDAASDTLTLKFSLSAQDAIHIVF
jgi:hypothetical protein